jgi:hypothetical protein
MVAKICDFAYRARVTSDHGYCPVFQILAKFSPNNQNQSVAGCSVFGFAGGENFSGFRASGRNQALRSRPGPPVATKALSSPTSQMRGPHGRLTSQKYVGGYDDPQIMPLV